MKKLLFILLTLAVISCNKYEDYNYEEVRYQTYGLPVNSEMADSTNMYGMGTRTTDGGYYSDVDKMLYAYNNNELTPADTVKEAWWVLIYNENISCPRNNQYNGRVDMPGFNTSDVVGKCVYINENEQTPNCSNCSNGVEHYYKKEYLTDGQYLFVRIWARSYNSDGTEEDVITKVYVTFDYNPVTSYYLLVEDLAGDCLDFNDLVIVGGRNVKPRVIYRMASYALDIYDTHDNLIISLPENDFGERDIELPIWNMNTPNDWNGMRFVANGIDIPIMLKSTQDMPAVIATDVTYQYHRDENTMTIDEFATIPFYGK